SELALDLDRLAGEAGPDRPAETDARLARGARLQPDPRRDLDLHRTLAVGSLRARPELHRLRRAELEAVVADGVGCRLRDRAPVGECGRRRLLENDELAG